MTSNLNAHPLESILLLYRCISTSRFCSITSIKDLYPPSTTMAHLQYYCCPGFWEAKREELWYSQAVRVGDYIEISGQGVFAFVTPNTYNQSKHQD